MAPDNSMYEAQLAIMSDQTNRTMRELEKLEEKLDRDFAKIDSRLDYSGNKIHKLSNIITRMEAESKSNTKWVGWAIAGAVAIGDLSFNLLLR